VALEYVTARCDDFAGFAGAEQTVAGGQGEQEKHYDAGQGCVF
jgi:hypothetical protein